MRILLQIVCCLLCFLKVAFASGQDLYPIHLGGAVPSPYQLNEDDRWEGAFSVKIGQEVYGLSSEDIRQKRAALSQNSQTIFRNLYAEKTGHIPFKTHRLWLTSQETPCEADPQSLKAYAYSLMLSTTEPWEHHFWCLRKDQIPETIQFLQKCGTTVHIHELDEILSQMKGRHIYQAYYDNKHFCLASNIVRQNIIYLNGGVYADLGTLQLEDLTPFAQAYDHMWWSNGKFLDQSFFGYQQNDPLMKNYLDKLDQLHEMTGSAKALTPTFETQAFGVGHPI